MAALIAAKMVEDCAAGLAATGAVGAGSAVAKMALAAAGLWAGPRA